MIANRILTCLSLVCLVVGCQVAPRQVEPMFRTTIAPRPVLTSSSFAGNEYDIVAVVSTNRPDWPITIPKRVHLQLSTDGGSNYNRYLAYGLPVTNGAVSYRYSMPWWDESLLTEHARIRLTDMEGNRLGASLNNFTIAGVFWHTPAAGNVLVLGANVELEWIQSGVGNAAELGFITPTEPYTPITTLTNLVAGTNRVVWKVTSGVCPRAQIKLVLTSVSSPTIWGATGILSSVSPE